MTPYEFASEHLRNILQALEQPTHPRPDGLYLSDAEVGGMQTRLRTALQQVEDLERFRAQVERDRQLSEDYSDYVGSRLPARMDGAPLGGQEPEA